MTPTYRYVLRRNLGFAPGGTVLWIMLNPSTADDQVDDPTIRRVKAFSMAWGHDSLVVVNLFAMRATDPRDLYFGHKSASPPDIVGPANDATIIAEARPCRRIVCAWGANKAARDPKLGERASAVESMLCHGDRFPLLDCLGITKRSHEPRHPLYVPRNQAAIGYELAVMAAPLSSWGAP